jgi:probable addiction module antidote protein
MNGSKAKLVGSDFQEHLDEELRDPEFAAEYLRAAIEANDLDYFKTALGNVAKARGIQNISSLTNIPRATLYSILKEHSNPSLTNVQEILRACGLTFGVVTLKANDQLTHIVGTSPLPRAQVVKALWSYIKANGLQSEIFKQGEKELVAEEKSLKQLVKRTHKLVRSAKQFEKVPVRRSTKKSIKR